MAATGPLPSPQKLTVSAKNSPTPTAWTATISGDSPWIALSSMAGVTPAAPTVSVVGWRAATQAPGTYSGKISFRIGDTPQPDISVIWTVVPRGPEPTYTYPALVQGCTAPPGFPDPALCMVPDEAPPGSFRASAAGASFVDANFGGSVKIMTPTGFSHTYSANNPLSVNGKYLMVTSDGFFHVIDVATSKTVFSKVPANQDFFWDSYSDSVYYYVQGTSIIKHDLDRDRDETVVDYSKDTHKFSLIKRGGTTGASKDNWISFFAPNERNVCTFDLNTKSTYCSAYDTSYGDIDFILDAKGIDKVTGRRYVILLPKAGSLGVYSVNVGEKKLQLEYRGPEDPESNGNHDGKCDPGEKCMNASHTDSFEDASGIQYLVFNSFTSTPCEVSTGTYQLNSGNSINLPVEVGGGKRKIMTLWQCPFPNSKGGTDEHIGCAKNAPYCVISTVSPYRSVAEPPIRFPHATEIIVMRGNGLELRRLAQSRSVRFTEEGDEAYWAEPRAAISNDGSLVVADSNFGSLRGGRVTTIKTGFGKSQAAVLNSASMAASLAPGANATLFGSGMADCTAAIDSPTLPTTLCGATVTFNGVPAPLTYVSPEQINVLVPRSLKLQSDVTVSVTFGGTEPAAQATIAAANFTEAAPAIFSYSLDDGVLRAIAQNAANVLNGPTGSGAATVPAKRGDMHTLWANALGPIDTSVADGSPVTSDKLPRTLRKVEVFVNGVPQTVQFAGIAPGSASVYQINVLLNPATPVLEEGSNDVWLRVNDSESPHLTISIQ